MAHKRATAKKALVRPKPIDGYVGARVRARRTMLGMSQQTLAAALGITFQQLQKNEKGINRIASSRLLDLSYALDVPIQFFFDDMPAAMAATATAKPHQVTASGNEDAELLPKAETLKLVRAYYEIKNPRLRKNVFALAKALAGE